MTEAEELELKKAQSEVQYYRSVVDSLTVAVSEASKKVEKCQQDVLNAQDSVDWFNSQKEQASQDLLEATARLSALTSAPKSNVGAGASAKNASVSVEEN